MPHLVYNFIYRAPRTHVGPLLRFKDFLARLVSKDMHVAAAFGRKFYWSDVNLWPDQILDKTLVVLHGKDELLEVEKVHALVVKHASKLLLHKNYGHAEFLLHPAWCDVIISHIAEMSSAGQAVHSQLLQTSYPPGHSNTPSDNPCKVVAQSQLSISQGLEEAEWTMEGMAVAVGGGLLWQGCRQEGGQSGRVSRLASRRASVEVFRSGGASRRGSVEVRRDQGLDSQQQQLQRRLAQLHQQQGGQGHTASFADDAMSPKASALESLPSLSVWGTGDDLGVHAHSGLDARVDNSPVGEAAGVPEGVESPEDAVAAAPEVPEQAGTGSARAAVTAIAAAVAAAAEAAAAAEVKEADLHMACPAGELEAGVVLVQEVCGKWDQYTVETVVSRSTITDESYIANELTPTA
ncbi:MAG: hypothetical protein WDW38_006127 [Sanguina aurantia]